jgi:hypothetical protein
MARIYVADDTGTNHVEITADDEGQHAATCYGCKKNLMADANARWSLEETIAAVEVHVDQTH